MSDIITNAYHSAKENVNKAASNINDAIHETSLSLQTADHRNESKIIKERVEDKVKALNKENIGLSNELTSTFGEIQKNHDSILERSKKGTSGTDARKDCAELLRSQEKLEEKFNSEFAKLTNNPKIEVENDILKAQREYRDSEGTAKEQAQQKIDEAQAKYNEVSQKATDAAHDVKNDAKDAAHDVKNDAKDAAESVNENVKDAVESVKSKFKNTP